MVQMYYMAMTSCFPETYLGKCQLCSATVATSNWFNSCDSDPPRIRKGLIDDFNIVMEFQLG